MQAITWQRDIRERIERQWQQLVELACAQGQVSPARVLRCEGALQLALDAGAIDAKLLQQWNQQALVQLQQTISNVLWSAPLQVEDGCVQICLLHPRAPVYVTTQQQK